MEGANDPKEGLDETIGAKDGLLDIDGTIEIDGSSDGEIPLGPLCHTRAV
jgi:hypothetical protein